MGTREWDNLTTWDAETGTLTVDEFALHDILCSMREQLIPDHLMEQVNGQVLQHINIVPENQGNGPDECNEYDTHRWERRMQVLIDLMGCMDADYHVDFEYTC